MKKPPVWQMVKEAVENIDGSSNREAIKKYIHDNWEDIKDHTIICQVQVLTVNHPSRTNYSMNKKPRSTTSNCRYDFCYQTNDKVIVKYNIEKHGVWEIYETPEGRIGIKGSVPDVEDSPESIWQLFSEGSSSQVIQTKYERSPGAREACIEHYGYPCTICGFDFEKRYGERGRNFIHIHHLIPLADVRSNYRVDPVKDLRPVCPNCHSMLHRIPNRLLSIEELKVLLR